MEKWRKGGIMIIQQKNSIEDLSSVVKDTVNDTFAAINTDEQPSQNNFLIATEFEIYLGVKTKHI